MTLPYIINVALVLAACLTFYKLLLHRETFYKLNRYMLIVCLVISFALPLLHVPQQFSLRKKETAARVQKPTVTVTDFVQQNPSNTKPAVETPRIADNQTGPADTKFSFAQLMIWLFWIYWFGVIVFAASFLFQLVLLIYRAYRNPVILDGKYRIVEVSGDKAPCSFGNNIFINPEKYEWETYNQILLHEKIHIRQKHTIDILITELLLIFQWFNPFAWSYRREIESNLEFLTDDQLMRQKKVDKKTYQLSLMKVSAPHFPLSLTTNYNQSILKKRIAMMNIKRSNLHTAWKYFFLMPVLAFLACLLNEPVANGQTNEKNEKNEKSEKQIRHHDIETEGSWFATIRDDKVSIQFRSDEDKDNDHNFSGNTYKLSELSPAPKEGPVTFKITRDAGTIEFTGRFEGNTGMGHYKFVADKTYGETMSSELKEKLDDRDLLVFFFVDVKKGFLPMLKSEGYTDVTKDELIPVAALGIDQAYIRTIKNAGFKDVSLEKLVPLKALGIDEKYITEIKSTGYKNVTTDQLVTFKAQGIDKEYISKVRQLKGKDDKDGDDDANDIVSFKAMGITEEYINSFKAVGLNHIPNEQLVSFKAIGVTPEYIKSWQALGFKDINPEEFVGMKSQNVTPEYMKSFTDMGYKNIKPENLVSFRALSITPEFIKSFEAIGYKNIDFDELPALKAQNITPEFIKGFENIGFKNIDIDEIVAVKAVGVTPEYIKEMKSKGFNYNSLQKYVTLKSID
jgi:beta-lactamase regulating signal transducer with metallopeptidase domain